MCPHSSTHVPRCTLCQALTDLDNHFSCNVRELNLKPFCKEALNAALQAELALGLS